MAKAFVSGSQASNDTVANGGTLAYAQNVGSGTLLVAGIMLPSATASVSSITDSLGNTWALGVGINGTNGGAGTNRRVAIWYAHCATGGANTVTFNWNETVSGQVAIHEFTGFTNGVTKDQTNSAETDNQATASCGEITTTVDEEVIVAVLALASSFAVSSRSADFNALASSVRVDRQYRITASTVTTDGAVTFAATEDVTACIVSFYETAGGGGGDAKPWLYRSHTMTWVPRD